MPRIAAMREGAYDYLQKPFRPDEVMMTVRKAEERESFRREVEALRSSLGAGAVRRPGRVREPRHARRARAGQPGSPATTPPC